MARRSPARRSAGVGAAAEGDAPGGRRDQAHGEAEERGLAGAVRADEHGRRSGVEDERDPVEDRHLAHEERGVFERNGQVGGGPGAAHPAIRSPMRRVAAGRGVDDNHQRYQHDAETDRERQVAFGGLQRDRGGHGAGEAVDIAADDDHRADFGRGPAESRKQRGEQAKIGRPRAACATARDGADIHRRELVAVFEPEILDGLPGQRRDDRGDQDGLSDDHRLRREQDAPRSERPRARQHQIHQQAHHDRRQAHRAH